MPSFQSAAAVRGRYEPRHVNLHHPRGQAGGELDELRRCHVLNLYNRHPARLESVAFRSDDAWAPKERPSQ